MNCARHPTIPLSRIPLPSGIPKGGTIYSPLFQGRISARGGCASGAKEGCNTTGWDGDLLDSLFFVSGKGFRFILFAESCNRLLVTIYEIVILNLGLKVLLTIQEKFITYSRQ
jgi:hypothetical protein